jgi:galactokinase
VATERVDEFVQALSKGYENETGLHPEIYVTRASNGAELMG